MGILTLGVVFGGLLVWLIAALLWLLNDYRKYKRNHLLLFFLLFSMGTLYAQEGDYADDISTIQVKKSPEPARTIFGHNIFATKGLSFEPNMNLATPDNYILGPGDEVIIDVWGASENNIRQTISPEGDIMVDKMGPISLNGLSVLEANKYLQQKFSTIYAGIAGKESSIKLSLGQIRSIQINVMGEVAVPGTYTLSSYSSVFHALYRAGGVNAIGSLRNIQLVRNGKKVADLDMYDFIMNGKQKDATRLMEGDVILVPPYDCLVDISGKVKRPMSYEMKRGETLFTLLAFTGGFTGDSYRNSIRLVRKSGREKQIYNVDDIHFGTFQLMDGDALSVGAVLDRFENKVEVRGAVYRQGIYQLSSAVKTVKQLILQAEGLRGDAFLNRALLRREKEDLSPEMMQIDLKGIMAGHVADIPLHRNDILFISSIQELKEEATLSIQGEIARPGSYPFADNMTIKDLIIKAGGLLESASLAKIDVTRRIKEPGSTKSANVIGKTFELELKDGFLIGKDSDFILEPFDVVAVRRSPSYHRQKNVTIAGEVLFSGRYALSKKNERLSDLISRAGGLTEDAYIRGARLLRQASEEELKQRKDVVRLAKNGVGKDSISMEMLEMSNLYSVGIELNEAIENPGTAADIVLREGDMIYIPEFINTVKINGEVMYPNTVLFEEGAKLNDYVNQAGGFGFQARKRHAYVIRLNGTISRLRGNSRKGIEPGCEIIVPSKEKKKGMSSTGIAAMNTSLATLVMMISTMINIAK